MILYNLYYPLYICLLTRGKQKSWSFEWTCGKHIISFIFEVTHRCLVSFVLWLLTLQSLCLLFRVKYGGFQLLLTLQSLCLLFRVKYGGFQFGDVGIFEVSSFFLWFLENYHIRIRSYSIVFDVIWIGLCFECWFVESLGICCEWSIGDCTHVVLLLVDGLWLTEHLIFGSEDIIPNNRLQLLLVVSMFFYKGAYSFDRQLPMPIFV